MQMGKLSYKFLFQFVIIILVHLGDAVFPLGWGFWHIKLIVNRILPFKYLSSTRHSVILRRYFQLAFFTEGLTQHVQEQTYCCTGYAIGIS